MALHFHVGKTFSFPDAKELPPPKKKSFSVVLCDPPANVGRTMGVREHCRQPLLLLPGDIPRPMHATAVAVLQQLKSRLLPIPDLDGRPTAHFSLTV